MNQKELFLKLARIKASKLNDYEKCTRAFDLVREAVNSSLLRLTRKSRDDLRRRLDDFYVRAQHHLGSS